MPLFVLPVEAKCGGSWRGGEVIGSVTGRKAVRLLKGRDVKAARGRGLSGGEEGGKGGGPILGGFCLGWGRIGGGNGWAGFWEWPCWAFFLL